MKIQTLSICVILVLMMAVPVMFLDTGGFMKGFNSDKGTIEKLKEKVPKGVRAVVTDKEVEIYKWRDEHGFMQFSEVSPVNGGEVEKITLSPADTNIMDALIIPEEKPKQVKKSKVISLRSPYTPGGMKDMIDGSLQLKEQVSEQQTEQQKMLDEILKQ